MLRSEMIILKPLSSDDLNKLYEWINDRDLVLFNTSYRPISFQKHQEWYNQIQIREDVYIFGIYTKQSEELIGTCQLLNINYIHSTSELQIRIGDPNFRNKGYGKDTIKLLLKFAFNDLNLNRIFLYVFSNNYPAIKLKTSDQ